MTRRSGSERPFEDIVVPAARAAASIVPLLGYGRAHLVLGFAATVNTGEEEWPLTSVHGSPIERDLDSVDGRLRGRRELEA
jgi:hypothetical protein